MDKLLDRLKQIIEPKTKDIIIENLQFPTKNLLLEVTNYCNCKCLFCANEKMTHKRGHMDKVLAKDVMKQAYDLGMREVGFYTTGEPLLYPHLKEQNLQPFFAVWLRNRVRILKGTFRHIKSPKLLMFRAFLLFKTNPKNAVKSSNK